MLVTPWSIAEEIAVPVNEDFQEGPKVTGLIGWCDGEVLHLHWQPWAGVHHYDLRFQEGVVGPWQAFPGFPNEVFTDTFIEVPLPNANFVPGTTYLFEVRAFSDI